MSNHVRGNTRMVEIAAPVVEMALVIGFVFPPRPGECVTCIEGLPDGAQLVDVTFDRDRRVIKLSFCHESFAPVDGDVPHQQIVFGQRTEGL